MRMRRWIIEVYYCLLLVSFAGGNGDMGALQVAFTVSYYCFACGFGNSLAKPSCLAVNQVSITRINAMLIKKRVLQ
jgi:hypothetical protein